MNILVISPLYPPDTAPSALYVKELATRLKKTYQVTIATYGLIPEHIPGVSIHAVNKNKHLFTRLLSFARLVYSLTRTSDILYVENGPSTELPLFILSFFIKKKIIFHTGDESALLLAKHKKLHGFIHQQVIKSSCFVISDSPPPKPEVLPFADTEELSQASWNTMWEEHIARIDEVLKKNTYHGGN